MLTVSKSVLLERLGPCLGGRPTAPSLQRGNSRRLLSCSEGADYHAERMKELEFTRRDLLGAAGAVVAGAASATATGGCALLPRGGAGGPTAHRCQHRFCRFYRQVRGEGRCALDARVAGGEP